MSPFMMTALGVSNPNSALVSMAIESFIVQATGYLPIRLDDKLDRCFVDFGMVDDEFEGLLDLGGEFAYFVVDGAFHQGPQLIHDEPKERCARRGSSRPVLESRISWFRDESLSEGPISSIHRVDVLLELQIVLVLRLVFDRQVVFATAGNSVIVGLDI